MSETLTKKLRIAAMAQHTNRTPNPMPTTIPQSFWPPDPFCQCIATAVAKRKETDVPLNTTPRMAAFLAVHSFTRIMVRQITDELTITLKIPVQHCWLESSASPAQKSHKTHRRQEPERQER